MKHNLNITITGVYEDGATIDKAKGWAYAPYWVEIQYLGEPVEDVAVIAQAGDGGNLGEWNLLDTLCQSISDQTARIFPATMSKEEILQAINEFFSKNKNDLDIQAQNAFNSWTEEE